MKFTLGDLAKLVDGQLEGPGEISIEGATIIRDAGPGDITLADNPKLAESLASSEASAVLVPAGFRPAGIPSLTVEDVHASFAKIISALRPHRSVKAVGVSAAAHVSRSAELGANVVVHPGAVIGDGVRIGTGCEIHSGVQVMAGCTLGAGVTLFPKVVLYEHTVVGDRVLIHAGAVLGAYGFGYEMQEGKHQVCAQLGHVVIEDDVEIGANTTIDRGTYGATTIGQGTKIDNQVMIGHNCRIGRHNLLCSQVGIAGSCTTGDYVVMGGQVGLRDHIDIGHRVLIGAKSGVMRSIPDGEVHLGMPATPEREQMVKQAAWAKLPEMRRQFKILQRQVQELGEQLARDAA